MKQENLLKNHPHLCSLCRRYRLWSEPSTVHAELSFQRILGWTCERLRTATVRVLGCTRWMKTFWSGIIFGYFKLIAYRPFEKGWWVLLVGLHISVSIKIVPSSFALCVQWSNGFLPQVLGELSGAISQIKKLLVLTSLMHFFSG